MALLTQLIVKSKLIFICFYPSILFNDVIIMALMKKFLVLLAIFCIIGSVAAVSAADESGDLGGYVGSQYQDDGGWAGSQYNATLENAVGAPVNGTAQNATANVTGNASTSNTMPAAGNPILALFAVTAVLGGSAALKRK